MSVCSLFPEAKLASPSLENLARYRQQNNAEREKSLVETHLNVPTAGLLKIVWSS